MMSAPEIAWRTVAAMVSVYPVPTVFVRFRKTVEPVMFWLKPLRRTVPVPLWNVPVPLLTHDPESASVKPLAESVPSMRTPLPTRMSPPGT